MNDYRTSHFERGSTYDATISANPFDAYMARWESRHVTNIVLDLFPDRSAHYLDFACGTGRITATVAPLCRSSVGVDVSPSMLQVARDKVAEATFHLCDLTRDEALDIGTFDLVTSFRFLGNAQPELRETALSAIVKRIRPGGFLVINSHCNPYALHVLLHRLTGGGPSGMDLHLGKLRRLIARHGLRIVKAQPIGAWMYRSSLLDSCSAEHPKAVANEHRFSHPALAWVAPDVVVVAQRIR